jgi:GNAT superfamily N-acetyltransferase
MSSIEVRPFRRGDREQLTKLVNSHVQAVVPGVSVSVSTVLAQLEREPAEFIEDPWVAERTTLVASQRQRVVAAAHLQRYASDERVSEDYRGAGVIRWLVCWAPDSPWADASTVGDQLAAASLAQLARWQVRVRYADGSLPAPGCYGVPEQWPHVRAIYGRAGFKHTGDVEFVLLARVADLPRVPAPVDGLRARRSVGVNGTRFTAVLDGSEVGSVEVESLADGERLARLAGWADVGNLFVHEDFRRRGIARWLFGEAAGWLELGRVERLLAYAAPDDVAELALYERLGFAEITKTARGWST